MEDREKNYQKRAEKLSSYQTWFQHHEPILQSLYLQFLDICNEKGLPIEKSFESRKDFYRMMYEESNGKLIDKKDYLSFYPEVENPS